MWHNVYFLLKYDLCKLTKATISNDGAEQTL
jgi:hypothetical protein